MNFEPLRVTAVLANEIAVSDDWTPQLEGLLVYQLLAERHLASPNASHEQARKNMAAISDKIPLQQVHGLWCCSSPVYAYKAEATTKFRKRWEPDGRVNWGKRKAKFNTTAGGEKSYDLPLFYRLTSRIDWHVVGDQQEIKRLLSTVTGLGKKRSHGFGQVIRWEVNKSQNDLSIVCDKIFTRPIPVSLVEKFDAIPSGNILKWGYKPPIWLPENIDTCVMPEALFHG